MNIYIPIQLRTSVVELQKYLTTIQTSKTRQGMVDQDFIASLSKTITFLRTNIIDIIFPQEAKEDKICSRGKLTWYFGTSLFSLPTTKDERLLDLKHNVAQLIQTLSEKNAALPTETCELIIQLHLFFTTVNKIEPKEGTDYLLNMPPVNTVLPDLQKAVNPLCTRPDFITFVKAQYQDNICNSLTAQVKARFKSGEPLGENIITKLIHDTLDNIVPATLLEIPEIKIAFETLLTNSITSIIMYFAFKNEQLAKVTTFYQQALVAKNEQAVLADLPTTLLETVDGMIKKISDLEHTEWKDNPFNEVALAMETKTKESIASLTANLQQLSLQHNSMIAQESKLTAQLTTLVDEFRAMPSADIKLFETKHIELSAQLQLLSQPSDDKEKKNTVPVYIQRRKAQFVEAHQQYLSAEYQRMLFQHELPTWLKKIDDAKTLDNLETHKESYLRFVQTWETWHEQTKGLISRSLKLVDTLRHVTQELAKLQHCNTAKRQELTQNNAEALQNEIKNYTQEIIEANQSLLQCDATLIKLNASEEKIKADEKSTHDEVSKLAETVEDIKRKQPELEKKLTKITDEKTLLTDLLKNLNTISEKKYEKKDLETLKEFIKKEGISLKCIPKTVKAIQKIISDRESILAWFPEKEIKLAQGNLAKSIKKRTTAIQKSQQSKTSNLTKLDDLNKQCETLIEEHQLKLTTVQDQKLALQQEKQQAISKKQNLEDNLRLAQFALELTKMQDTESQTKYCNEQLSLLIEDINHDSYQANRDGYFTRFKHILDDLTAKTSLDFGQPTANTQLYTELMQRHQTLATKLRPLLVVVEKTHTLLNQYPQLSHDYCYELIAKLSLEKQTSPVYPVIKAMLLTTLNTTAFDTLKQLENLVEVKEHKFEGIITLSEILASTQTTLNSIKITYNKKQPLESILNSLNTLRTTIDACISIPQLLPNSAALLASVDAMIRTVQLQLSAINYSANFLATIQTENISGHNFYRRQLTGCDVENNAFLKDADFENTVISNCKFTHCDFSHANWCGANLTHSTLIDCTLTRVKIDHRTQLDWPSVGRELLLANLMLPDAYQYDKEYLTTLLTIAHKHNMITADFVVDVLKRIDTNPNATLAQKKQTALASITLLKPYLNSVAVLQATLEEVHHHKHTTLQYLRQEVGLNKYFGSHGATETWQNLLTLLNQRTHGGRLQNNTIPTTRIEEIQQSWRQCRLFSCCSRSSQKRQQQQSYQQITSTPSKNG